MATLPPDLDAVTSLPTTITANVTAGHTGHSEIIHKALRAVETAWASLAETGALDAEAIRDLMAAFIVGTGLVTVTHNDAADTLTVATTATANSSDATLLARANHTGTQDPATTLTAWVEAVVDAVAPALVSGVHTNISFAYDDAAGKINATAVGGSGGGPIPSTSITDSTTVGRAVLTAIDAATARAAIGMNTAGLIPFALLPAGTSASQVSVGTHTHTGGVTQVSDLTDAATVLRTTGAQSRTAGTLTFSAGTIAVAADAFPQTAVTNLVTALAAKATTAQLAGGLVVVNNIAATNPPRPNTVTTGQVVLWLYQVGNAPALNGTTTGGAYASVNNVDLHLTFA